ncbi:N-methylhydantoinase A [Psychrobacillus sp. OK028]|uniref:hydantoinase/oxoprolinase family protein n=1 Tax=Psychrobacillus sp. OK028 TaxID=1884359 RepID=UPI00088A8CFF|nr:hydantoinase/oxoprolinase family protein [Psychrobacillus sp. OK028]SDM37588.1 N-methylhydantoinase A [Psychrobacillus sp. OK028]
MSNFTLGIDVGGTFTDFLILNSDTDQQLIEKVLTTPHDPSEGVLTGIENIALKFNLTAQQLLTQTKLIVHGTTVTTNAVLTDKGAKTGLITTEGFRDVLQMRRGVRSKEHLYDNKYAAPQALVPRYLIYGAKERTNIDGEILTEISKEDLRNAAELFKEEGVSSVAICFMHSYANPANEIAAKRYLEELLPDVFISISTDVASVVRLYNRVSTVTMNSYVGPILKNYIGHLVEKLQKLDFDGELLIMQSNGGVTNPMNVVEIPATTVLSGPAGGPVAGSVFAKTSGFDNAIVVDMGGTSFEASIIDNGEISIKKEGEVKRNLISLPMADIHTIGSGGGSIAWIDDGRLLKVGPQSATAVPGPACYDRGGLLPTCSDADLVLGYLNPDYFLGGGISLNIEKAKEAVLEHIAKPLGLSLEEAALGIYEISNINMANGIKEATVLQGHDPRSFPLVVAGGAGPVHAAMIAKELDIKEIIVPKFSSVLCAVGMLASNLRHDYVKTYNKKWSSAELAEILNVLEEDRTLGLQALLNEGVIEKESELVYGLDMRYVGQHYEVTIEVNEAEMLNGNKTDVENHFHREHERLFGFNITNSELEIMNIRLTCKGKQAEFKAQTIDELSEFETVQVKNTREIFDPITKQIVESAVYDGETMKAGSFIQGPAIIELTTTTILVPTGFDVQLNKHGNFIMRDKSLSVDSKEEEKVWIKS